MQNYAYGVKDTFILIHMFQNTSEVQQLHLKLVCGCFRADNNILLEDIIPMPASVCVVCKMKCSKLKKKKKKKSFTWYPFYSFLLLYGLYKFLCLKVDLLQVTLSVSKSQGITQEDVALVPENEGQKERYN